MGSIFRYEHKACGFEYKHFDGVGFMGMELEQKAYEKIEKGELGEEWQNLLRENPSAEIRVNNTLCYCEKCKKYHSLPQVKLVEPEKDIVFIKETIYCPTCKEAAIDMDNVYSVPCPVCGEKLRGQFAGLWD